MMWMKKGTLLGCICVLWICTTAPAAMVAQWTFMDLNDVSNEDAVNDVLSLSAGNAQLLTTGENTSGVLELTGSSVSANRGLATIVRSAELSFDSNGGNDDSFTLWARVKIVNTTPMDRQLLGNETATGGFTWRIDNSTANPLRMRTGGNDSFRSNLYVNNEEWHNVAMVFNGGTVDTCVLYKDGDTRTQANFDLGDAGAASYVIGNLSTNGAKLYVEELRVYNEVLSTSELNAIEYVVPEPATLTLLAAGGAGILIRRKR
jgi:hypothetical protein